MRLIPNLQRFRQTRLERASLAAHALALVPLSAFLRVKLCLWLHDVHIMTLMSNSAVMAGLSYLSPRNGIAMPAESWLCAGSWALLILKIMITVTSWWLAAAPLWRCGQDVSALAHPSSSLSRVTERTDERKAWSDEKVRNRERANTAS